MTGVLDLRQFFGKVSGPFPKNMCELKVTRHPTSRHYSSCIVESTKSIRIHPTQPDFTKTHVIQCDHHMFKHKILQNYFGSMWYIHTSPSTRMKVFSETVPLSNHRKTYEIEEHREKQSESKWST